MTNAHCPTDFSPVTAYLHVERGAEFLEFARAGLDAKVRMDHRGEAGALAHTEISINGVVIELSEARADFPATRSAFHVFVADPDAAHQRALAAGARELQPVADQPYGERGGAVQDSWGNNWYFAKVTDMATRTDANSPA